MLRQPQSRAAAEAGAAEIAGLEPAAGAALLVIRRLVGHEALDRHAEERHGDVGDHDDNGERSKARSRSRECSRRPEADRAQHARDHVPCLAAERRVGDRRPQELPRVRNETDRNQPGDILDRNAGLGQQVGNGNREIARHHPERQDEDHEDPRMDGTSSHAAAHLRDELIGICLIAGTASFTL